MRFACALLYAVATLGVLVGAVLTWRGLGRSARLTWDALEEAAEMRKLLDPGARRGLLLIVAGAVLNAAASIWSLYLPA